LSIKQFFSTLWKTLYKQPRNRLKEERFLKTRLAFVDSIKLHTQTFDKEILVIRTDDIGDYILFRNSLELLKKAWPDYKVTLIGHALWQPIAESWDKNFVDEFIWLQKGRFMKDEAYSQQFLKSIATKKPEIIIAPSYSRNTFIDGVIAQLIPAKQKYCWQRNDRELRHWLRKYCDAPFTHALPIPNGLHEFDLNKQFMQQVSGQKLQYNKAFINPQLLPDIEGLPQKYVVLFPGAAAKRKRWDTKNFAQVADYITQKHSVTCLVCGSKGEGVLANEIIKYAKNGESIIDFTGKTDLLQLATVINGCQLIITNDTSAAHYAAALDKNTIALLNGNSYGRFFPYPIKFYPNIKAIYPSTILNPVHDWAGMEDIDKIKVVDIENEVDVFLKNSI
jgi:ADP-heptose:LPS heptosyltransferase